MRFLIACWPFEGHVFPQMAIAQALRGRGHEVAFYSGETIRERIESSGVGFFGFSAVDTRHYLRVQHREADRGVRRQSLRVAHQAFRDWLVETMPGQVADLRVVMGRWQPDVIISDLSMWGPMLILWESDRIPVAGSSTFLGPMIPSRQMPPWGFGLAPHGGIAGAGRDRVINGLVSLAARGLRRRLGEIRADYGLEPLQGSVNAFLGTLPLYLVPSVRELDYNRDDLPPTVHYVGPCPWFPPSPQSESDWLNSVPRDLPWVHVTEGTSHYQDPFLLRAASNGLAGTPVRVIGTTGGNCDPRRLGPAPPAGNVHLTRWLSHGVLLPQCAVVVTTGGPATILASLGAGVPLVVVPTSWDKPDNARRVAESGVGVRLRSDRCSPGRLRAAVLEILRDPGYRVRAGAMARTLAEAPGPSRSADLLEDLAAAPTPRPTTRPASSFFSHPFADRNTP